MLNCVKWYIGIYGYEERETVHHNGLVDKSLKTNFVWISESVSVAH